MNNRLTGSLRFFLSKGEMRWSGFVYDKQTGEAFPINISGQNTNNWWKQKAEKACHVVSIGNRGSRKRFDVDLRHCKVTEV